MAFLDHISNVCQTGYVDYDTLEERALDFRPKLLICGGSAYPRDWDYKRLRDIANKVRFAMAPCAQDDVTDVHRPVHT